MQEGLPSSYGLLLFRFGYRDGADTDTYTHKHTQCSDPQLIVECLFWLLLMILLLLLLVGEQEDEDGMSQWAGGGRSGITNSISIRTVDSAVIYFWFVALCCSFSARCARQLLQFRFVFVFVFVRLYFRSFSFCMIFFCFYFYFCLNVDRSL